MTEYDKVKTRLRKMKVETMPAATPECGGGIDFNLKKGLTTEII